MREIKFRGITVNGEVVFGFLIKQGDNFIIQNTKGIGKIVLDNSISEFTGMTDFYGNDIYERDVLCAVVSKRKEEYTVSFINGAFRVSSNVHNNVLCLSHSCKRQMLKRPYEI